MPENLVSRGGFSRPVPRQPAHFHTQAEFGLTCGIPPEFRLFIYFIVLPVLVFLHSLFCLRLSFRVWSDGLFFLFGVFLPQPGCSCFSEPDLLFLGTCFIFSRKCWDFLWVFFYFYRYFSVPYFGLACDHGNSFLCLEELEREGYWIEVRTVFNVKTTTTTTTTT